MFHIQRAGLEYYAPSTAKGLISPRTHRERRTTLKVRNGTCVMQWRYDLLEYTSGSMTISTISLRRAFQESDVSADIQ